MAVEARPPTTGRHHRKVNGMRITRTAVAIGAAVVISAGAGVIAGAAITGHDHGSPSTTIRAAAPSATAGNTRTVTKWRTRTIPGPPSAECSLTSAGAAGPVYVVPGNLAAAGYNGQADGRCAVTFAAAGPSDGTVTLTDAAGRRSTYALTQDGSASTSTPATAAAADGPPMPHVEGATHSVLVDCASQQCTSLPGAGPGGGTCGPVVGGRQWCVW